MTAADAVQRVSVADLGNNYICVTWERVEVGFEGETRKAGFSLYKNCQSCARLGFVGNVCLRILSESF